MGSHGRPKKKISGELPQVAALAQCLRDLMDARGVTKERLRAATGIRGHGRLDRYLNGDAVPEERVLEEFFVKPLAAVRELADTEALELRERYAEAVREQPPRRATPADRVPILENDLAAAEETIARVWSLVTLFAAHGEQHRQAAEELREALHDLEARLAAAKVQVREAENAERQSDAQVVWLRLQTTWFSQQMSHRAVEIADLHEHARVLERALMDGATTISRQGEAIRALEDRRLLYDRLSVHHRRQIAALHKAREDDEAKYRQALHEWDRAERRWARERAQLADQVADLRQRLDRPQADPVQVGTVSPRRGNAAGPVEIGRAGWHLDAADSTLEVYWDGQQWTGEKRPTSPAAWKALRPRGRHALPEPAWAERAVAAAWQGYCVGFAAAERQRPGWASQVISDRPALPELLVDGRPAPVPAPDDPARYAFEDGLWLAIENRRRTERAVQKSFRRSRRSTGGGRHVSPTASTVPDLPRVTDGLLTGPLVGIAPFSLAGETEHLLDGDGPWSTSMSRRQNVEHNAFWAATAGRFRLRR